MKPRWIVVAWVTLCTCTAVLHAEQAPTAPHKRSLCYSPRSAADALAWQERTRSQLQALLNIDDLVQIPGALALRPERISLTDKDAYLVEELRISSTPGRRISIIVTLPKLRDEARPAVVCIGGHGSTLYSPYGPDTVSKDQARVERDRIYKAFGTALSKAGYVTISTTVSQHEVYETGRLLMGERLRDLMRCVDYLESLPQVDKTRIGCAGLSLGGEMAMWLGALDQRMAATVSAGFLTIMDHMEQNHCMCWKFPGLRDLVDFADIYALSAPRALQCQNGLQEPKSQFYVPLARQALEQIRPIYCDLNRPENCVLDIHPGGHEIDLPALMYFCDKHLKGN